VPSLDLRFADNKSLVDAVTGASLVTLTRASSGTYVGSDGVLRTAVTNLLLRSEEFNDASWIKQSSVSVSANTTIAPNGTLTADTITWTSASVNTGIYAQILSGLAAFVAHTRSIYVRADSAGGTVQLTDPALTQGIITINLTTEWQRIQLTENTPIAGFAGVWIRKTASSPNTIYLWGAQLEQSATVGEYIPTTSAINSAPRFDHNPTTGESLGLLVEEQRTNSIRNNTMVGAVAGTPGTLPTNWSTANGGLTRSVVDVGTSNGINYIDIRFNGTSTGTSASISFGTNTEASVANGQTWTQSIYAAVVGGSAANLASIGGSSNMWGSGGTVYLGELVGAAFPAAGTLGSTLVRYTGTGTIATASVTSLRPYLFISFAVGAAIDITLRIGLPQLEQGATVSSVIPTTTAAATRSASLADLISSAIANNIRSFYVEFSSPAVGTRGAVSLNDNTANERADLLTSGTDPRLVVHDGGAEQVNINGGTVTAGVRTRIAVRINTNDFAISINGGAVATDTSGTLPTVDRLMFGRTQAGEYLNGRIARFTGWTGLLPNSTLQSLTQ
jgi:hypothetical protein